MEERFSCLDVLPISWTSGSGAEQRVCGTLLEVWSCGGVIQIDEPIAKGETFTISVHGAELEARVESYDHDEYGWYLKFGLTDPWFPGNYQPAYLMKPKSSEEAKAQGGGSRDRPAFELHHTITA
jgi:hypothetical protein